MVARAAIPTQLFETPDAGALDYVRQARRLRSEFARKPARLHAELQHLGKRLAPRQSIVTRVESVSPATTSAASALSMLSHDTTAQARVNEFATQVAASLSVGMIRYSQRLALLRHGENLGLSRFEANLLIASVEHQLGKAQAPVAITRSDSAWPMALRLALTAATALTAVVLLLA